MKVTLILVGKTTDLNLKALIDEYEKRLSHYNIGFQINVIPDVKNSKNMTEEIQKAAEADAILKAILPSDFVVLLDERGKQRTSTEFADWMETKMMDSSKRLVFIIGGPYGFSKKVYDRAEQMMALSKMTFSHQMVRLVFIEQLYRAMTIIRHEPYHHQ